MPGTPWSRYQQITAPRGQTKAIELASSISRTRKVPVSVLRNHSVLHETVVGMYISTTHTIRSYLVCVPPKFLVPRTPGELMFIHSPLWHYCLYCYDSQRRHVGSSELWQARPRPAVGAYCSGGFRGGGGPRGVPLPFSCPVTGKKVNARTR